MKAEHAAAWREFIDSGLLWWVNRILHTFGWSIVYLEGFEEGEPVVYPCRTTCIGFDGATDGRQLKAFKAHLKEP